MKEIFTKRLEIKCLSTSDILGLYKTKSTLELIDFFGFDNDGYEFYKTIIENGIESYNCSYFMFLIIEKNSATPIGEVGFHTWNKKHHKAELFYKIWKDDFKQKGYMKEALPEILKFGFEELDLHRIQALVANYNIPSIKLIQMNGFTKEGTKRGDYLVGNIYEDSDLYSLLKSD